MTKPEDIVKEAFDAVKDKNMTLFEKLGFVLGCYMYDTMSEEDRLKLIDFYLHELVYGDKDKK